MTEQIPIARKMQCDFPKLIIGDEAMELAVQRLTNSPIYAGPNGTLFDPGMLSLLEPNEAGVPWLPADERTRLMILGADACQDLVYHFRSLVVHQQRARALKAIAVPVCNFMDAIKALLVLFNDPESKKAREDWSQNDRNTYIDVSRRFKKNRVNGPVRRFRNKYGAHADTGVFKSDLRMDADDVLGAVGESLVLLQLMLNHDLGCVWIREVEKISAHNLRIVETLQIYPYCMRWIADEEGNVVDVHPVKFAAEPRHKIQVHIDPAIAAYNDLVRALGSSVPGLRTSIAEKTPIFG